MPSIVNSSPLSLENIGRGDTIERFDEAMSECLLNIKDPNTSLKARKILITVTVTPSIDRDTADFNVTVEKKFQAPIPYQSSIIIGNNIHGDLEAHESIEVKEDAYPDDIDQEDLNNI
jgi:hypothetical protein